MSNRKLVRELGLPDDQATELAKAVFVDHQPDELKKHYEDSVKNFTVDTIIKGKVLNIVGDDVLVDIGYKSEGAVPRTDFLPGDSVEPGREIEVFLETIEDESGVILLSKQKADKIRGWERIITNNKEGDVIAGRVIRKIKGGLLVDVGVPVFLPASQVDVRRVEDIGEFLGKTVECKILKIDDKRMNIIVSRRRLLEEQRAEAKTRLLQELKEGDVVEGQVKNIADFGAFIDLGGIDGLLHITDLSWGRVIRKIKGGLLVDVGVPVFLPASQVDVRRVEDIGEFLGKTVECKILKIDDKRMNIIVSRRRLLEEQRAEAKTRLLQELKEGDIVDGQVKNIADFGAFIDLGGIDGLLHITDLSWGRVNHPSEVVKLDQKVKVKILKVDPASERIALGYKQLQKNPWEGIASKFTVGQRVKGKVVNLMPYGAFVELEPGIEGLVHISEMSWTKRINHPSEILQAGETVEVAVLGVDIDKQELSLGLKQTEANPWDQVEEKYKSYQRVLGKVRNTTSYGAFVELEDGVDGLLHINDMSWTKKVVHPNEVVKKGEQLEVVVLSVDKEKKRIALGLKQLTPNPWETSIPEKYRIGNAVRGKITKLVSFGAFVELEKDLEGLLHISKVDKEAEQAGLGAGDVIEVKVVKLEPNEGKIGLSLVKVLEKGKEVPAPAPAPAGSPIPPTATAAVPPPPAPPTATA